MVNVIKNTYSANEKMNYIQEYLNSNKSVIEFCKENSIAKSTFYLWLKKYDLSFNDTTVAVPMFQDITSIVKKNLEPVHDNINQKIKMTLPNNIVIEFDCKLLHTILEELK